MLLSILFLFLNSTDIPTKQVPETKYVILSYILKLRIKRACRTVSFHAVFYMFSGKEQGGWEKGLLLPCQDGTFLLIEFQKYKSKKYLRQYRHSLQEIQYNKGLYKQNRDCPVSRPWPHYQGLSYLN